MPKLQQQQTLHQRAERRSGRPRQRLGDLSEFKLGGARPHDHPEGGLAHRRHGTPEPHAQHPDNVHHVRDVHSQVEEELGTAGGQSIGARQHRRIGIVDLGKTRCPLQPLQYLQIDPGRLGDLTRRDVDAVVTKRPIGGQQHRHQ
jgi:hypothetical protein